MLLMETRSAWFPITLGDVTTLKLPLFTLLDHAAEFPFSKPSAKISSGFVVGVAVGLGVNVAVGVGVKVGGVIASI